MFDLLSQNLSWLAFGGLLFTMCGVAALLQIERSRSQLASRLSRANGTGPSRTLRRASGDGDLLRLRSGIHRAMVNTGERLAVILGGEARDTASDLASAGYRSREALLIYAFLKTVLPVAALVLGLIWIYATQTIGLAMFLPLAVVIGIALSLSKAVDGFVAQQTKKRLEAIRRSFPDMLELLVISSEAGLGPQPALHRVATELAATSGALAQDILQMVSEMHMTNDRREAYNKLNDRIPLPEIGVFTQTLDQSDTYGTPFSKAMRTLINEQRANRLMALEEKAARLPVIMTLPLIFCIMPAVFVVLIGPAALSVFDNIISGG